MPVAPDSSDSGDNSAAPQPSLLQTLQGLWRELPGLISDRVDLLALELQRAGRALMQIVALIVIASILAVTAWLALWSAVVGMLMALGLHWSVALLAVLVVNLGAAWWAVNRMRSLVADLRLPATRRHLALSPSPQPKDPAPEAGTETRAQTTPPSAPPYASNASHAVAP